MGFVDRKDFCYKMEYLCRYIKEYTGVYVEYGFCENCDPKFKYRKPNTGMLDSLKFKVINKGIIENDISTDEMLMIGDASGKKGQYSDTDKKTAVNYCIDYLDVEDFIHKFKK